METIEDYTEKEVHPEMGRLQEEYRETEMNQMRINLDKFQYHLEDRAAVAAIVGDDRIELVRSQSPISSQFRIADLLTAHYGPLLPAVIPLL